jgi:hypothetical protein
VKVFTKKHVGYYAHGCIDKLCVFVRGLLICANFKLEETYIVGNHFESGKFFKCEAK